MLVICGLKYCRTGIGRPTLGLDMGDDEGGGIGITGMFKVPKPGSRQESMSRKVRRSPLETDALYLMHPVRKSPGVLLLCKSLASASRVLRVAPGGAGYPMLPQNDRSGLPDKASHCHISLRSSHDHSFFVQFDAGASDAFSSEEFNLREPF